MNDRIEQFDFWNEMMTPPEYYFEDEVREGFLVCSMMKRFWAVQLKVLAEIDKICKKHDLRWYAAFGTLLGAVRHGGFVPWDDDMDIFMMRDDYIRFIEYAQKELPAGYMIRTPQLEENYEPTCGRIISGSSVSFYDDFLRTNFGCPYFAGMDIFPLDGLYDDKEKEQDRIRRIREVSWAILCIKENKCDKAYKDILERIQIENKVTFKEKEMPFQELLLLGDAIYSETKVRDSKEIAFMSNWVKYGVKYSKKWFEDIIYLPFEYVHIPVSAYYEAVLWNTYGIYMKAIRGGNLHDYPLYSKQEKIIKDDRGINSFAYTMPNTIRDVRENESVADRCAEMIAMLRQVSDKIGQLCEAGEYAVADQLKSGSTALVGSLDAVLSEREKYRSVTGAIIDRYREFLSRFDAVKLKDEYQSFISETDRILNELTDAVGSISGKKEILFLPVKAEWWNTLEPEWRQATSDENNDVYVMPLVYLEKDFIQDEGEEKNDSALFPEYVKVTDIKEYDIASRHPDVVYIQVPYDGFNTAIAIPNYFYSDNLLNLTDELVYVPCYETDDPESDEDIIVASLRLFIEQPAVYNADRVILRTEAQRRVYIDTLVGLTGADTKDYWSKKISVSEASTDTDNEAKEARKAEAKKSILKHYGRESESDKTILLMQVNPSYILCNEDRGIDKIRRILSEIRQKKDTVLCMYVPHFASEQLEKILSDRDEELFKDYQALIEEIKADDDIIYDSDDMVTTTGPDIADAYYGTTGELGHRCGLAEMPVMYMANVF